MASLFSLDALPALDPTNSHPPLSPSPGPTSPKRFPPSRRPSRHNTPQPTPSTSSFPSGPPSPRHPLRTSPRLDGSEGPSLASSVAVAGPSAVGVRSRKQGGGGTGAGAGGVEADVTRPSLQRVTSLAARKTSLKVGDELDGGAAGRRSLDELARSQSRKVQERDVIVHQIQRTDTIASISLRYGITPQALRLSNRLWPSDSIHLRKSLNIPLDQCHLPSSSAIGGIAREADGGLVLWEKDTPSASTSASTAPHTPVRDLLAPTPGATTPQLRPDDPFASSSILAPTARRQFSASMIELGSEAGWEEALPPNAKGKGRAADAVAAYLPGTNNPYASPAPTPPPMPFVTPSASPLDLGLGGLRITDDARREYARSREGSVVSSSAFSGRASTDSNNPFANPPPGVLNGGNDPATFGRKTLTIERVPAAALSFFPPPNTTNGNDTGHSTPQRPDSFDENGRPVSPNISYAAISPTLDKGSPWAAPSSGASLSPESARHQTKSLRHASSMSNFHSTARRTSYGGPSLSGKPSSHTPLAPSGVSVKAALDWLGVSSLASSTGSNKSSGKGGTPKKASRWDILNFGGEEDEAAGWATGMERVEHWATPPKRTGSQSQRPRSRESSKGSLGGRRASEG